MNPYKHLQSVLEHPGSLQHNYFGSITSWLLDIIECSRKFHACMEAWLSILEISRYLSNSSYPEHHPRWIQDCKSSYKIPRYWWNWHTLYTCENLEHTHRWLKLYDVLCYAICQQFRVRSCGEENSSAHFSWPIIAQSETATWKKQDCLWNRKWMQHLREVVQVLSCSS